MSNVSDYKLTIQYEGQDPAKAQIISFPDSVSAMIPYLHKGFAIPEVTIGIDNRHGKMWNLKLDMLKLCMQLCSDCERTNSWLPNQPCVGDWGFT